MKTLTLSRNSWHYYMATKFGGINGRYNTNLCKYLREVLIGTLMATLAFIFLAIVAFAIVCGAIVAFTNVFGYIDPLPDSLIVVGIIVNVCIVISACYLSIGFLYDLIRTKLVKNTLDEDAPDSFLKVVYRTWRYKICVYIDFK